MRTLFVKQTTLVEIEINWGFTIHLKEPLYVKCNAKGFINWDKTAVYTHRELIERNNIIIKS